MEQVLEREQEMAKKRGRPATDRDERSVRISRINAARAATVAKAKGKTVSEVLDEIIAKPLAAEYARVLREAEKEAGA